MTTHETINMFKYRTKCYDCNGAGEEESWVEYEGFDRAKAIEAKHHGDEHHCGGSIFVLVPGPKGWYSPWLKRQEELEEQYRLEEEWAYADWKCEQHYKELARRKMVRANSAEITVHIQKDEHGSFEYVLTITFYDKDGDMDHGWSTYECETIRKGAQDLLKDTPEADKEKVKAEMTRLGICWE